MDPSWYSCAAFLYMLCAWNVVIELMFWPAQLLLMCTLYSQYCLIDLPYYHCVTWNSTLHRQYVACPFTPLHTVHERLNTNRKQRSGGRSAPFTTTTKSTSHKASIVQMISIIPGDQTPLFAFNLDSIDGTIDISSVKDMTSCMPIASMQYSSM